MTLKKFLSTAAVVFALVGSVHGAQRKPLPVFPLTGSDGAAIESGALEMQGTWLLVYVQPRCAPCDALLRKIASDERPGVGRIVVIGGGMDLAAVTELAAKHPNLAQARWFADPERGGAKSLEVEATPTVFGLRRSTIEWRLAGAAQSGRELESILFTWLEKR